MLKKMLFFFGPYTATDSGESLFVQAMKGNSDFRRKRAGQNIRRRQAVSLESTGFESRKSINELASTKGSVVNLNKLA